MSTSTGLTFSLIERFLAGHGITVERPIATDQVRILERVTGRQALMSLDAFQRASKHGPDALLRGLRDWLDLLAGPAAPLAEPPAWDPSHREIL